MSWRLAPAVAAGLSQATERWPGRSRASDGTIGDPRHAAAGTSEHNPDRRGVVLAFDLTDDPAAGCDAHALVRAAVDRRDRRILYVISRRRIWSTARAAEGWRPYNGGNPHVKHAHVSVARAHEDDTSPWWPAPVLTVQSVTPTVQEDDMFIYNDGRTTFLREPGASIALGEMADVKALHAAGVGDAGRLSDATCARLAAK